LLATYQLHYQNLRSLHWNIKGQNFFELHLKYEELYNRYQIIIDDIAERLLVLEEKPFFSFTQYLENSKIAENKYITDGNEGMMSDLIREKEKTNWMFKSWLEK
jgi:starvation-inducible DNA-binding protein